MQNEGCATSAHSCPTTAFLLGAAALSAMLCSIAAGALGWSPVPVGGSVVGAVSLAPTDRDGGTVVDWLGNVWIRAGSPGDVGGPGEANWYIDQLATGDAAAIRYAVDHYYLNSSDNLPMRWGKGWLAKHIVVVLLMRALELRDELAPDLRDAIDHLAVDALDEATFRIDGCGVVGNSCVEDFASMMIITAIARNLYPHVVQMVGGAELRRLEEKYFRLTFTTRNRSFGLVRETSPIDGQEYAMVQNHGGQSAVYAAIVLTQLGNALSAYLAGGHWLPSFYTDDADLTANITSLFSWLQTTALADGSSFVFGCLDYTSGQAVACNDPAFANTVPVLIPAGRAIALLFGTLALQPGYQFRMFDPNGPLSPGRLYQYDALNPDAIDIGLHATLEGGYLVVRWTQMGTSTYDCWGPGGRIGTTSETIFATLLESGFGPIRYGVVARTQSGRVAGHSFALISRHTPRRRLSVVR